MGQRRTGLELVHRLGHMELAGMGLADTELADMEPVCMELACSRMAGMVEHCIQPQLASIDRLAS